MCQHDLSGLNGTGPGPENSVSLIFSYLFSSLELCFGRLLYAGTHPCGRKRHTVASFDHIYPETYCTSLESSPSDVSARNTGGGGYYGHHAIPQLSAR